MDESENLKRIGVGCSAVGSLGFLISVFMDFNRSCMLFSDCAFIIGIFLILGIDRTIHLFASPKRIPATAFMGIGIIITFFNHGFYGAIFQLIGAFLMFGGFLPHLLNSLSKLPVIGPAFRFSLPSFLYGMNDENLPR